MQIVYLTCPRCGKEFYIHEEFAGRGHDWFCPFCGHEFKEDAPPLNAPAQRARGPEPRA